MKIEIQQFEGQFNVALCSKEGVQPFLTIRGCRVVEGRNGRFVSWPARKTEKGYWNHCVASEPFAAAVLAAYEESAPKPAIKAKAAEPEDDPIPF